MSWLSSAWDSAQDWFTGSSSNKKAYGYQSNLDAANRAWQSKEAGIAYERQKNFFDYQAQYNTPKNQMARLSEAGLNPNLVYGNGAMAVQANTGSVPQASGGSSGHFTPTQNRLMSALSFITDMTYKGIMARKELKSIQQEDKRLEQTDRRLDIDEAKAESEIEHRSEQTKDVKEGLSNPTLKYIHRQFADRPIWDHIADRLVRGYDYLTGNISGKSWLDRERDQQKEMRLIEEIRRDPKAIHLNAPSRKEEREDVEKLIRERRWRDFISGYE